MASISYRADIDGLRALAVLSVVLYHAHASLLSGGYIGVDIFFVISGYLITSIIYAELNTSRFSFGKFWMRRARRILPASYLVMASTLLAFAFVYPVVYYKDLGASLATQSLFGANIYFWLNSGYFESAAELKPLLHTWSLAVEEQFYLLFPFFLWLLHRYLKYAIQLILATLCLVSLALCIWASREMADAAFYLLPFRAWELGAGALLAVLPQKYYSGNHTLNSIVSALALLLIGYGLFALNHDSPFPSYNALYPVLGTAGLIWANSNRLTWAGQFFSLKPVVGIGLISYSLYLWHWPLIVFSNWVFAPEKNVLYALLITAGSILLAYITYRLVETPLRKNRTLFTDRFIIRAGLVVTPALLALGVGFSKIGNSMLVDSDHSINRYYQQALQPEANRSCSDRIYTGRTDLTCRSTGSEDRDSIDFFVLGDSYASAIVPAFVKMTEKHGYNIEYALQNGCQPVQGMRRVDRNFMCADFNQQVLEHIASSNIETVVLVSSFVQNIERGKLRDIDSPKLLDPTAAIAEFENRLAETVARLKASGVNVVAITEPPLLEKDPVAAELRRRTLGMEKPVQHVSRASHEQRIEKTYKLIDNSGIDARLDYTQVFCPGEYCRSEIDGNSLYKDKGHISNFGAEYLYPYIMSDLESLGKSANPDSPDGRSQ